MPVSACLTSSMTLAVVFLLTTQMALFGVSQQYIPCQSGPSLQLISPQNYSYHGDGEVFVFLGETLHLACSNSPQPDTPFVFAHLSQILDENTTRLAGRIELHYRITSVNQGGMYYCWQPDNETNCKAINVDVDYPLRQVEAVDCVLRDWIDMICNFSLGVKYDSMIDIDISFSFKVGNNGTWTQCPNYNSTSRTCVWPAVNTTSIYSLNVTVKNTKAKRAVSSPFLINATGIVTLSPVRNLQSLAINSSCVQIVWNDTDVDKKLYDIRYMPVSANVSDKTETTRVLGTHICDLDPNTNYSFLVRSRPAAGGYYSSVRSTTSLTPPAPPHLGPGSFKVTNCSKPNDNRNVTVYWKHMITSRALDTLLNHQLTVLDYSGEEVYSENSSSVNSLNCGKDYRLQVRVANKARWSPNSTILLGASTNVPKRPDSTVYYARTGADGLVRLTVEWRHSGDVDGFTVYYCRGSRTQETCKGDTGTNSSLTWRTVLGTERQCNMTLPGVTSVHNVTRDYIVGISAERGDYSTGITWDTCILAADKVPEIPEKISCSHQREKTISVTWKKWRCNETYISHYILHYCLADSATDTCTRNNTVVVDRENSSYLIHMEEFKACTVWMQAESPIGTSGPSDKVVIPLYGTLPPGAIVALPIASLFVLCLAFFGAFSFCRRVRRNVVPRKVNIILPPPVEEPAYYAILSEDTGLELKACGGSVQSTVTGGDDSGVQLNVTGRQNNSEQWTVCGNHGNSVKASPRSGCHFKRNRFTDEVSAVETVTEVQENHISHEGSVEEAVSEDHKRTSNGNHDMTFAKNGSLVIPCLTSEGISNERPPSRRNRSLRSRREKPLAPWEYSKLTQFNSFDPHQNGESHNKSVQNRHIQNSDILLLGNNARESGTQNIVGVKSIQDVQQNGSWGQINTDVRRCGEPLQHNVLRGDIQQINVRNTNVQPSIEVQHIGYVSHDDIQQMDIKKSEHAHPSKEVQHNGYVPRDNTQQVKIKKSEHAKPGREVLHNGYIPSTNIQHKNIKKTEPTQPSREVQHNPNIPRDDIQQMDIKEGEHAQPSRELQQSDYVPHDDIQQMDIKEGEHASPSREVQDTGYVPHDDIQQMDNKKGEHAQPSREVQHTGYVPDDGIQQMDIKKGEHAQPSREVQHTGYVPHDDIQQMDIKKGEHARPSREVQHTGYVSHDGIHQTDIKKGEHVQPNRQVQHTGYVSHDGIHQMDIKKGEHAQPSREVQHTGYVSHDDIQQMDIKKGEHAQPSREVQHTGYVPHDGTLQMDMKNGQPSGDFQHNGYVRKRYDVPQKCDAQQHNIGAV